MPREYALSVMDTWRLGMQGQYKYVRGWRKEARLFDMRNDPHENENLASAKPELTARLDKLLMASL